MIVQVAVPCPLYQLFDYTVDDTIQDIRGMRVSIPFGSRELVGIILRVVEKSEQNQSLKKAMLLDEVSLLSVDLINLGEWMSDYYHAPIGEIFKMLLPPLLRKKQKYGLHEETWISIGPESKEWRLSHPRAKRGIAILAYIESKGSVQLDELQKNFKGLSTQYKALLSANALSVESKIPAEYVQNKSFPELVFSLNEDQIKAIQSVQFDQYQISVLEGVTGSGKTAVYLELIKQTILLGEQVLVLVPEIGLTPQFIERIETVLNVPYALIHSNVNDVARALAYERALLNQVPLVIGTRSALFTPFKKLGLIIVDEAHDQSYRQRDIVRYSAHDTALKRAQILNIPIVLGSATPSLETILQLKNQKYQYLPLPNRAKGSNVKWEVIDLNDTVLIEGISEPLLDEIEKTLARKEQVMIYINRRGYSPILLCESCGWIPECPSCSYHLTTYKQQNKLRCHHCGFSQVIPKKCPVCQSHMLKMLGIGTERIEKTLENAFPIANVRRFDRDILKGKQAFDNAIKQVQTGDVDIIVGTQILAKGHDFNRVTLVGMIDVDGILYSSDFRAEEKLAQTLMQVSGRAGRNTDYGKVMIQTYFPNHDLFNILPKVGYSEYARAMLGKRELLNFPPFSYHALVQLEGKDENASYRTLHDFLQYHLSAIEGVSMTEVSANTLSKRQNYYRFHSILQSSSRRKLHEIIHRLIYFSRAQISSKFRFFCEIDPWDID